MAKLPATVIAVNKLRPQLYVVQVAFWDGTLESFIIHETLATVESVKLATMVYAQLVDIYETNLGKPYAVSNE